ncbi:MAG: TlpA disulfide reductase family protein [Thermoanaerobaculia bacterium]
MPKYGRFAVSFLSVVLIAAGAHAADLRDMKTPETIPSVFPAKAWLRLLTVWATWCIPCVEEMPDLVAIDKTFGSELAIAGVSLDDMLPDMKRGKVVSFLDQKRIAFPNVYYTGLPDALGDYLKFRGEIPVTILYDRNGKELWRHQGRLNKEKTIAAVRENLRRK